MSKASSWVPVAHSEWLLLQPSRVQFCLRCPRLLWKSFSLTSSGEAPLTTFPSRQVLALVFVRKVMDLCFSKRELSWLDDLMPESKKKKLDDAKKKAKEEEVEPC